MYVHCWLTCCAVVAALVLYCPSSLAVTSSTCKNNDVWGPTLFAGQCYDQQTEEFCCATCSQKKLNIPADVNANTIRPVAIVLITLSLPLVVCSLTCVDFLINHHQTALIVLFTSCGVFITVLVAIDLTAINEKYAAWKAVVNAETSYGTLVDFDTIMCITLCPIPFALAVTDILNYRLVASEAELIVVNVTLCVFAAVFFVFDLAAVDEKYVRICCLATVVPIDLYRILLRIRLAQQFAAMQLAVAMHAALMPPPIVAATSHRQSIVAGG